MYGLYIAIAAVVVIIFLSGIKIVRPTHRGLVETLGKYTGFARPGFHWIFPVIQKIYRVNITEQMIDAEPQVIITNDNLNATVDAQVYFRVKKRRGERQGLPVQRQQLLLPGRQPGAHDAS